MALRSNDTAPITHLHMPTSDIIYSRLCHFASQGTEIERDRYSKAKLSDIK